MSALLRLDCTKASKRNMQNSKSKIRLSSIQNFVYPATFQPESHGAFTVTFPDFPEAITSGRNREDALTEAEDCLQEAIAGRMVRKENIPSRIAPEAWRNRSASSSLPGAEARAIPGDARKTNQ